MDYDRITTMEDNYVPMDYFSFIDLNTWEESNLTEMTMVKCNDRVFVGKIHYLKKEFQMLSKFMLNKQIDVKWSPQGKYLLMNEGNVSEIIYNIKLIDVESFRWT